MHPSAGHHSGTLVNALLHHCGLPPMQLAGGAAAPLSLEGVAAAAAAAAAAAGVAEQPAGGGRRQQGREEGEVLEGEAVDIDILLSDDGDDDDGDLDGEDDGDDEGPRLLLVPPPGLSSPLTAAAAAAAGVVRPGIVHRLDRGTTGLLVVAKTDAAHASLAAQFKARQVGVWVPLPGTCWQAPAGRHLLPTTPSLSPQPGAPAYFALLCPAYSAQLALLCSHT